MEMPNVSNKIVLELDMIIEVPGGHFIDVRVRVQFEHILCLVVRSFRKVLKRNRESLDCLSWMWELLTQPNSMILSFAYVVAAKQLKKKKNDVRSTRLRGCFPYTVSKWNRLNAGSLWKGGGKEKRKSNQGSKGMAKWARCPYRVPREWGIAACVPKHTRFCPIFFFFFGYRSSTG